MSYKDPPKEHRFTSDNQPAPERKRVPKYKTRFKKFILDNIDIVEEKMRDGNYNFWQLAFERAYGKEKEQIEHSGGIEQKADSDITEKINKLLELREKDVK